MNKKNLEIAGAATLILAFFGLLFWYVSTHPAPKPYVPDTTVIGAHPETKTPVTSGTKTITEHATYYDIRAAYPSATPLAASVGTEANAKAIASMKGFEENMIDAFKENGDFANLSHDEVQMRGLDQKRAAFDITYSTKTGKETVSYIFTMQADTLGAHPTTYFRTFTFNTQTGESLTLGDLFVPTSNYLAILSAEARNKLPATIASMAGSSSDTAAIQSGTTPDADNFQNWFIEGDSLVLIFPPYQVAAYSLGAVTLHLPLSAFKTNLKAEYR